MNEKFNKNAKVEKLTNMFLSSGEEKGLIVKAPYCIARGNKTSEATINNDKHNRSDITLTDDIVTELELCSEFGFSAICREVSIEHLRRCRMPTEDA